MGVAGHRTLGRCRPRPVSAAGPRPGNRFRLELFIGHRAPRPATPSGSAFGRVRLPHKGGGDESAPIPAGTGPPYVPGAIDIVGNVLRHPRQRRASSSATSRIIVASSSGLSAARARRLDPAVPGGQTPPLADKEHAMAAVVVVDNYDSFTWNLVHLIGPLVEAHPGRAQRRDDGRRSFLPRRRTRSCSRPAPAPRTRPASASR